MSLDCPNTVRRCPFLFFSLGHWYLKLIHISVASMNAVLAIETSVPQASVALWIDNEVVFTEEFTTDRSHNSMIFEPISQALKILGEGQKLSLIIVGTGPGSYSGTRVGIAAAQGVAIAHDCPAIGIGSLAAVSEARAHITSNKSAMDIGDARRGLYDISKINSHGEAEDAELMEADTFQQRLTDAADACLFTLDNPTQLKLSEDLKGRVTQSRPEATHLLDIWMGLDDTRRSALKEKPLSPAYLRPPFTSKAKAGHPLLR